MFKINWVALFLLIFLWGCAPASVSPNAMQPSEVGNGGHGVLIGSQVFLYDLWEANLINETTSKLTEPKITESSLVGFWRKQFAEKNDPKVIPINLLATKLNEIYETDPILAHALAETIYLYQWVFAEKPLNPITIPDPVYPTKRQEVVMIATRAGRFIYVNTLLWNRLSEIQQVALILHEAIYSLLPAEKLRRVDGSYVLRQNGKRVREIIAVLFGSVPQPKLRAEGLYQYVDVHELPMERKRMTPDEKKAITAAFIHREQPGAKRDLEADTLSVIGPATLHMKIRGKGAVAFPLDRGRNYIESQITSACKQLVNGSELGFFNWVLTFGDNDEFPSTYGNAVELKFEKYQEGQEIKQRMAWSHLTGPRAIDTRKSFSGKVIFASISRNEQAVSSSSLLQNCEAEVLQDVLRMREYLFVTQRLSQAVE